MHLVWRGQNVRVVATAAAQLVYTLYYSFSSNRTRFHRRFFSSSRCFNPYFPVLCLRWGFCYEIHTFSVFKQVSNNKQITFSSRILTIVPEHILFPLFICLHFPRDLVCLLTLLCLDSCCRKYRRKMMYHIFSKVQKKNVNTLHSGQGMWSIKSNSSRF